MTPDEIRQDAQAGTPWTCAGCGAEPPFDCDCPTQVACSGEIGHRVSRSKREILSDMGILEATDADRIKALTAENAALKERVAELEAALAPFARRADIYDPPEDDDWRYDDHDGGNRITFGQLRKARAALEKKP